MEITVNPTNARKNLFELIKDANRDSKPVLITGADDDKSAVLISKRDYDAMQETMALMMNGQLKNALDRKDDDSVDLRKMMEDIDNES